MKYAPETIGDVVWAHVRQSYGAQKNAAAAWGCSISFVNQVVHGERKPNAAMLAAIGYRPVEGWVPATASLPDGILPLRAGVPQ